MMPKVLHVSYYDVNGGAARAALRIHHALMKIGVDSRMAVVHKTGSGPSISTPLGNLGRLMINGHQKIANSILRLQSDPNVGLRSLNLFASGLAQRINAMDVDLVNLHWVGQEALSINEIATIRKPVVWTMHDMWPFSGAEHYQSPQGPSRWLTGYKSDRDPKARNLDIDAWMFSRKQRLWKDQTFYLISPSRWLADCASRSVLFSRMPCRVIPNCLDLTVYKPIDREIARSILNLAPNKNYVLFGAMASTGDPRKGFFLLPSVLQKLAQDTDGDVELLVFGSSQPSDAPNLSIPVHYMGNFSDDVAVALLYAAANVFAAPSTQDNLPNTVVEALAVGTPCVAFAIGGMPDMIDTDRNGYLVDAFDTAAFAQGIVRLLRDRSRSFAHAARAKAEAVYSEAVIAGQYLNYYREVLNTHLP